MCMLQLTRSPELILTALRSEVQGAPSWTVDWHLRRPLRIRQKIQYESHDWWSDLYFFYNVTASPMPPDSWKRDPTQPNILQIQGNILGSVDAILELQNPENDSQQIRHLANINNIKVLLLLGTVYQNSSRPSETEFPFMNSDLLEFVREHHQRSPEDALSTLLSHNTGVSISEEITPPPDWDGPPPRRWEWIPMSRLYNQFCMSMKDVRVVIHSQTSEGSTPAWPGKDFVSCLTIERISLAKLYPTSGIIPSNSRADISEHVEDTQFQECRLRPGDMVLRIRGIAEWAVVREDDGKYVFIDAVERVADSKSAINTPSSDTQLFNIS